MAVIKITEVWLDNANCDIETGMGTYLVVYLNNGQNLTVSLDPKAGEPLFADVITGKCETEAKTDSERVYWDNGASLTADEIIAMLQTEGKRGAE